MAAIIRSGAPGPAQRLHAAAWLRKLVLLALLALLWQGLAMWQGNPLLLPTFLDTARAFVIYTFESGEGRSSLLHGKPVAVLSKEPGRTLAVFAFPLSYIVETDARICLEALLSRMGYNSTAIAGDADNDGAVTAADLVMLINYLYRDGYLIDERNADVNGDCRVNVLDVVEMVDFLQLVSELPAGNCP